MKSRILIQSALLFLMLTAGFFVFGFIFAYSTRLGSKSVSVTIKLKYSEPASKHNLSNLIAPSLATIKIAHSDCGDDRA